MAEPVKVEAIIPNVAERIERLAAMPRTEDSCKANEAAILAECAERAAERWRRTIPARFQDAHVDQLDGNLAKLSGWDRRSNVLLVGNVGAGKTHAAVAAARLAHDEDRQVGYWPVVELLAAMRPEGDPQAQQRATSVDVLILDDIGTEKGSDWTAQQLYAVVNRRWLEQRPTIVTSNLPAGELERSVGKPMWSRLYHGALRLTVGGQDRRRES